MGHPLCGACRGGPDAPPAAPGPSAVGTAATKAPLPAQAAARGGPGSPNRVRPSPFESVPNPYESFLLGCREHPPSPPSPSKLRGARRAEPPRPCPTEVQVARGVASRERGVTAVTARARSRVSPLAPGDDWVRGSSCGRGPGPGPAHARPGPGRTPRSGPGMRPRGGSRRRSARGGGC